MSSNKGLDSILNKKYRSNVSKLPKEIITDFTSVPDVIKVYYKNNINITQIDKIIHVKLKKTERMDLLEKYKNDVSDILEIYQTHKKLELLEKYLDFASKYIRIERIKTLDNIFICKGCNTKLEDVIEEKDGYLVCHKCNCINSYLVPNYYIRDTEKNINYYDEDTSNFLKILDKFEGKTSLLLDEQFLKKLDNYFLNINMKEGIYYKQLPLNSYGKKEGTSKKILWNALESLSLSCYYDEANYIAHIYWGWKLPELSNYKEKILKDYRNTQNSWNLIKHEYKRSASLGTQFRLYVHLLTCEYPHCYREDFKLQENVESLRLHSHAWKRMCEMSDIDYIDIGI